MRQRPTTLSRAVLIDTSAYFALADDTDAGHLAARAILDNVASEGYSLFTTTFIAAETHALMLNRLSQNSAVAFLRELERGSTTAVHPTEDDIACGRDIIYRYRDKYFSLTDGISFAVMQRLRISRAFTFDRHFAQYGFTVLTAPRP